MSEIERRLSFIKAYFENARERIALAEYAKERGFPHNAIRLAQEAIELCVKAILRLYNVEYPKVHDVGPLLRRYSSLFPEWFRQKIPDIARISRDLSHNRGPAMYGNEEAEIPPNELYDERDAEDVINEVKEALAYCLKLFEEKVRELKSM
ncbi:MAG: HEPN domain-containing protein [Thermoprotei archaeon]|nr:HEPN domain-containing protein [Thermoprotei archaeon]